MPYKAHVFICTNQKSGKCASKGSEDLRSEVKSRCKKEFGKDVRINTSGCLDHCDKGIVAVVYPSGQWLFDLGTKTSDEDKIIDAVKAQLHASK